MGKDSLIIGKHYKFIMASGGLCDGIVYVEMEDGKRVFKYVGTFLRVAERVEPVDHIKFVEQGNER